MELIELIIRLIEWLASDKKKSPPQRSFSPVELAKQQAEWERRRQEWQEWQNRQAAAALLASTTPASQKPRATPPPIKSAASRQVAAPVPAAKTRPAPATAKAASIARWAKPNNLRSQFILTEVLKPPLAMREPR
jgi:hypothetical protein